MYQASRRSKIICCALAAKHSELIKSEPAPSSHYHRNSGYQRLAEIAFAVLKQPERPGEAKWKVLRRATDPMRGPGQPARCKDCLRTVPRNLRKYRPSRRQSQARDVREVKYVIAGQEEPKNFRAA